MCRIHARNEAGGLQMTLYIDTRPQLEWIEYNGRHMADHYEINQTPNERWIIMWVIGNNHYHDTLDEAKAAAQADYDARTAERFRKVKMPSKRKYQENDNPELIFTIHGYNTAIDALIEAIAKAKTPESLHTKP
jgi:hypothetical protein